MRYLHVPHAAAGITSSKTEKRPPSPETGRPDTARRFKKDIVEHHNRQSIMRRAFTLIIMTFVLTMPRTGVAQPLVFFDTVNPPFMYEYNGTVTGIYPRLIGEAFSIIGGTPKVAALPWGRLYAELTAGRGCVGGLYYTRERDSRFLLTKAYFHEELLAVFSAESGREARTMEDLAGLRVGLVSNWSYGDLFDEARRRGLFRPEFAGSEEQNLLKVAGGRLDCTIVARASAIWLGERLGITRKLHIGPTLDRRAIHMALPRSIENVHLRDRLNDAIDLLFKANRQDAIAAEEVMR